MCGWQLANMTCDWLWVCPVHSLNLTFVFASKRLRFALWPKNDRKRTITTWVSLFTYWYSCAVMTSVMWSKIKMRAPKILFTDILRLYPACSRAKTPIQYQRSYQRTWNSNTKVKWSVSMTWACSRHKRVRYFFFFIFTFESVIDMISITVLLA